MTKQAYCSIFALFALTLLSLPASAVELEKSALNIDQATGQAIGLFRAMDEGIIDVKFIPQNASHANVLVQNNTDRPLQIELPEAIAAVPVLGQFGPGGGQDLFGAGGRGGQGGGNQSVGGGLMGQGQGMGQNGMGQGMGNQFGNGFMRIPPSKVRKLTAKTVCLEHGKPDPNPRVAYRMIPVEDYTGDVRVVELCKRITQNKIHQNVAQAAAWHLANDMDWSQLAKVNRIQSRYLGNVRYFTATELKKANQLVATLPKMDSDRYQN